MVVPSKIANVVFPPFLFFISNHVVGTTENIECREKEVTQNIRKYTIIHNNEAVTIDVSVRTFVEDEIEYTEFKVVNVGKKRKIRHTF